MPSDELDRAVEVQVVALRHLAQSLRSYAGRSNHRVSKNVHGWADQVMQTADDLLSACELGLDRDVRGLWMSAWRAGFMCSGELGVASPFDPFDHPAISRCAGVVVTTAQAHAFLVQDVGD